jgi:asparagine synthase (glutamine-hydrolysing)
LETAQGDQDIGVLLSGGLDSSIIAAVMARHQKVQTFTVGYEIGGFQDERKFASEVASHIGSHHREVVIMDRDVPDLIDQVVWHLDEPLYTSVGLSTYVVSEFAAQYVKGVMSGDGSDELLMGYKYLVDPFEKARHGLDWKKSYLSQIGWMKGVALSEILHPEILKSHNKDLIDFAGGRCLTPFEQMRWFELNKRLPDYHLVRMDRLSMAHSLEVRVPFLRKGFVEEALNLDSTELVSASHSKALLKKSFEEMLPHHLIHRHKQPFTAPIDHWLRGVLKDRVYSLFHDSSMISSIGLNPQILRIIYQEYINGILSHELVWGIFMLLTWYDLIKKKMTN